MYMRDFWNYVEAVIVMLNVWMVVFAWYTLGALMPLLEHDSIAQVTPRWAPTPGDTPLGPH